MPKAADPDPTIFRRRLRTELRNVREAAGMTQRDVAAAMDWSPSKLIRIESGAVNIRTNDLRVLLSHYNVDSTRISTLIDMARTARGTTRWNIYRDVTRPEYIAFLGYEASASIIRNFEPLFVPGLLQTEEYARSVISVSMGQQSAKKVDPLVDLRMERQELLVREPSPSLHFIVDEAAIRRVAGGRDVMRRQLRHLRELAECPHITIRIIPFEYGLYPRRQVAYVLFEFADPDDEYILYVENPQGDYIVRENFPDERGEITPILYLEGFYELEQAIPHEGAADLTQEAINHLDAGPA